MKILLTGGNGQLGVDLRKRLDRHTVVSTDIDTLDIADLDAVMQLAHAEKPDLIINSSAFTNVDGCETQVETAYRVNAAGARNMAVAALETGARLIHISTDYVFNGTKSSPYIEFDAPAPINVYGQSKLAGESLVKEVCPRHFILRTSWLHGVNGNNFLKTMLKLAETKDRLTVIDDQIGTPTFTHDLISVIELLMETDAYGVYHASNGGECSWNEFARRIFELAGKHVMVDPISTTDYGSPALRPLHSVMDNFMLRVQFGYEMLSWEDGLKGYFAEMAGRPY